MNKRGERNAKGQTQISFGVIFSVLLIIVFIAFAIYGITIFLNTQVKAQIGLFKTDLQKDIDSRYLSTQGSTPVTYSIPKKVKQVCFVDDTYANMRFTPEGFDEYLLEHVDLTKTTLGSHTRPKSLCIDIVNGKVSMTLKKDYNELLVTIIK
jgi:hypothetical protein